MGSLFGGPKVPKGPSPDQIRQREEAARGKERERLNLEEEQRKSSEQEQATAALAEKESRRRRFAGQLTSDVDNGEDSRKRFLKGA